MSDPQNVTQMHPQEIEETLKEYNELAENLEPCTNCGFWVILGTKVCPNCHCILDE